MFPVIIVLVNQTMSYPRPEKQTHQTQHHQHLQMLPRHPVPLVHPLQYPHGQHCPRDKQQAVVHNRHPQHLKSHRLDIPTDKHHNKTDNQLEPKVRKIVKYSPCSHGNPKVILPHPGYSTGIPPLQPPSPRAKQARAKRLVSNVRYYYPRNTVYFQ